MRSDRVDLVRDRRARESDRVGRELTAVESGVPRGGVGGVLLRDDDVEVARPGLCQGGLRFVLHHLDADIWVVAAHGAEGRRHERERRRLEDRDADGARHGREGRPEVGLGAFEGVEECVRVPYEDLGLRGELHPSTDLPQELDTGLLLEDRELLRHRGGAEVEGGGDLGDRPADLEFAQQAEPSDVQHGALQNHRLNRWISFENLRCILLVPTPILAP